MSKKISTFNEIFPLSAKTFSVVAKFQNEATLERSMEKKNSIRTGSNNKNTLFSLSTTLDSSSSVSWSRDCVLFLCFFCLLSHYRLSFVVCFPPHQTFSYSRPLHLPYVQKQQSNSASCCFISPFHIRLWAFYATVFCLLRLFYYHKAHDGKRQSEQNG
jgi:hypothetical protein